MWQRNVTLCKGCKGILIYILYVHLLLYWKTYIIISFRGYLSFILFIISTGI